MNLSKSNAEKISIYREIKPPGIPETFGFDYHRIVYGLVDTPVTIYTSYKLSILLSDDMAAVIGSNVYNISRGDMIVFRPDEIHFARCLRSGVYRYLDFFIHEHFFERFDDDCSSLMFPLRDTSAERINLIHPEDETRAEVIHAAEKLAVIAERLIADKDSVPTADTLIFSYMIQIMSLCADAYAKQKERPLHTAAPAAVSKIIRSINENFTEPVSLPVLAEQIGCSVTYLTRTFMKNTGKTIHGYLTERRIDYAKKLLADGMSVTEVCYRAGFGDCSNFIKVFRKFVGVTPNAYKTKKTV